jgi:prepilin-type N-terminal cleavage/methylation domain-containing protein
MKKITNNHKTVFRRLMTSKASELFATKLKTKSEKIVSASAEQNAGFSLLELIVAMTITLGLMAIIIPAFSVALKTRDRESAKTDAITAAQAAMNVMSREIANSGYGLRGNGIVLADSNIERLHFRSNVKNNNYTTTDVDEDVTYFYDSTSQSVVRHDPNMVPATTGIINEISSVSFQYFDYVDSNSTPTVGFAPTANTGRVRITLIVKLPDVLGQPKNQTVTLTSDVTLRNSTYMLNQY